MRKRLNDSPINYFSDLFIVAMVALWIIVAILMAVMAVWSTVMLADNSIWCELGSLVAIPLSAGGAIWMIKNGVQHAIANNNGEQAHMDFPKVDCEEMEFEQPWAASTTNKEEQEGLG